MADALPKLNKRHAIVDSIDLWHSCIFKCMGVVAVFC